MDAVLDNTDRYFKGQQRTEEIICFFRQHWIVPIRYILGFIVLNFLLIESFFYAKNNTEKFTGYESKILILFVLIFAIIAFHRFFTELLNYYLTMVIITNFRLISLKKTILTCDNKDVIDLHEIQDIHKVQNGLIANLLNFGAIKISLSGVSDIKIIHNVPIPDYYFRRINETKRNYILKRQDKSPGGIEIEKIEKKQ